MMILLILSLFVPTFCFRNKTVFYWDAPPYIWEENGTMHGSIMHSIEMWEKFCANPKSTMYKVIGGYVGFSEQMYSVVIKKRTWVITDKGKHNYAS